MNAAASANTAAERIESLISDWIDRHEGVSFCPLGFTVELPTDRLDGE